ncbi:hypothetical protein DFH09DRAFT_1278174 [Mycena vulgaris]|nr:hypothetical protein DFH09DRAFT_1278174 [Mycena vulgaris]
MAVHASIGPSSDHRQSSAATSIVMNRCSHPKQFAGLKVSTLMALPRLPVSASDRETQIISKRANRLAHLLQRPTLLITTRSPGERVNEAPPPSNVVADSSLLTISDRISAMLLASLLHAPDQTIPSDGPSTYCIRRIIILNSSPTFATNRRRPQHFWRPLQVHQEPMPNGVTSDNRAEEDRQKNSKKKRNAQKEWGYNLWSTVMLLKHSG